MTADESTMFDLETAANDIMTSMRDLSKWCKSEEADALSKEELKQALEKKMTASISGMLSSRSSEANESMMDEIDKLSTLLTSASRQDSGKI